MNPRFVFIADTHHFSRTLSDGGEAYAYRSGSDQKCLEETGEIIDAAFEKILENPPDAVMIAGDLSDDGERVCHEEFREKLRRLQKHVPVYVITATHDWCCDETRAGLRTARSQTTWRPFCTRSSATSTASSGSTAR